MSYRLVERALDWEAISLAVDRLELGAPAYGYSINHSAERVRQYILQHIKCGDAYIVGEAYLLLVGTVEAWHSYDIALEERLVLCLHTGRLSSVPCALVDLAKQRGVDCILASDSSLNFRMGAVYKRAGFKPITHTYYKELPWDNGSQS